MDITPPNNSDCSEYDEAGFYDWITLKLYLWPVIYENGMNGLDINVMIASLIHLNVCPGLDLSLRLAPAVLETQVECHFWLYSSEYVSKTDAQS